LPTFIERLKNIYFIVFNYDRTLEYYLYNSIKLYYKTSAAETAEIVNNINIYHPYGQTGFLEFQKGTIKNDYGVVQIDHVYTISSLIKTFMLDNFKDDDEYKQACAFLYDADKVFFLGFAFYPQNIDLLFPTKVTNTAIKEQGGKAYIRHSNYYGTFYKISKANQKTIISMIKSRNGLISNFFVFEGKCVDFFDEFLRDIFLY